ncbi:tetratricopeptide repeat protein [Chitinophaga sp. GCM10012297]|uniref:Tetratricopeptide repeat protein n=1 Tax=Chitinophaga chungangae TaxID=2821488 RepID=A0ABS3YHY2_9BACT|nr:tetratricopeptide repeat protein [Chitinophaga chungangae]MBO9154302.1 tetratricopeptide repeat protein [Chitinophaga chungangae]
MDRISRLQAFLADSPQDSFLQHALALEYIKINDDRSARGVFEALLANDPKYVGSYYHLGKLLERMGEQDAAIAAYEKGMEVAREIRDMHAYNELQAAREDL